MDEYLNINGVVKAVNELLNGADVDEDTMHKFCDVTDGIDRVEIVRCKDCALYAPTNNGDHGYCGTPLGREVYPDDFCSKAVEYV